MLPKSHSGVRWYGGLSFRPDWLDETCNLRTAARPNVVAAVHASVACLNKATKKSHSLAPLISSVFITLEHAMYREL